MALHDKSSWEILRILGHHSLQMARLAGQAIAAVFTITMIVIIVEGKAGAEIPRWDDVIETLERFEVERDRMFQAIDAHPEVWRPSL